jgi:hypothetical protein
VVEIRRRADGHTSELPFAETVAQLAATIRSGLAGHANEQR